MCWGCLLLVPLGASACSAEPALGRPSSGGGAPGGEASGGASNDAERGGGSGFAASAAAAGGAASPAVGGSAHAGAGGSVQGRAGAADTAGAADAGLSADGCDLDAFARDFTTALAKSTAPSGCAIPVEGAPIGKGDPVSSAALDFVASTRAESPGALTFMIASCDTPSTATCPNLFDKYAGQDAGGNLWMLAHPFSDTIERCSVGVELSVWSVSKDGITSGMTYCLMGDRGGEAMGYCVFDAAVCAAKRR